jgi:hypothetical protein
MATEAAGGMLTDDGSRRRTLGGIFFVLVRQYVRANGQERLEHELFPRRHQRFAKPTKPADPPQTTNLTARPTQSAAPPPPAAAGRLRPRLRGRNELPPTALPSPLPTEPGMLAAQPNTDAARPVETSGQRDPNGALSEARRLLPPDSGCYGVGAMNETHTLLLRFHFPDVARVRYAATIDAIRAATGWEVAIHPSPHQEMLSAAARATLPDHVQSLATPSLHVARRTITLRYRGDFSEAERTAASTRFQNETGWALDFAAIG